MSYGPSLGIVYGLGLTFFLVGYDLSASVSRLVPSPISPIAIADAQMVLADGHVLHLSASYLNADVDEKGDDWDIAYSFTIAEYIGQTLLKIENYPVYLGLRYEDQTAKLDVDITSKQLNHPLSKSKSEYLTQTISPIVAYAYSDNLNLALAFELKNYVDRQTVRRINSLIENEQETYKESATRFSPSISYAEDHYQLSLSYRPYLQKQSDEGSIREPQLINFAYIHGTPDAIYHFSLEHKGWREVRDTDNDKVEVLIGYQMSLVPQQSLAAFLMYQPSFARSDADLSWSNMAVARLSLLYETPFEESGSFAILLYREQGSAWSKTDETAGKNTYKLVSHTLRLSVSQKF